MLGKSSKGRVVLAGAVAQNTAKSGHVWVFVQYLLGFRALGWDVLLLDSAPASASVPPSGRSGNRGLERRGSLTRLLSQFGLERVHYLCIEGTGEPQGLSRGRLVDMVRDSEVFLNFNGHIRDEEILDAATRRVFVDIDPGFFQLWEYLGMASVLAGHDYYVSVGQNIGKSTCPIPSCGHSWINSLPPVFLDEWPPVSRYSRGFTSVCSWRGTFGKIEFRGKVLGQRAQEFRRYLALPQTSRLGFEIALDIHPDEERDFRRLRKNGWRIVEPAEVAGDPRAYRRFIQSSMAEFSVAKNLYVDAVTGWISDRTACYLASGKPAVVQDTGQGEIASRKAGFLTFRTLEEAEEAVRTVSLDYQRHARAARHLALEYFSSSKVLSDLLHALGVT